MFKVKFTVTVPIRTEPPGVTVTDSDSVDKAKALVERYLYNPLTVQGTTLDKRSGVGSGVVMVRVEGEYHNMDRSRVDYLVNYQRDRFASGMYGTSEPHVENVNPTAQQQRLDEACRSFLALLDEIVPESTAHFAVETARHAVEVLGRNSANVKTKDA